MNITNTIVSTALLATVFSTAFADLPNAHTWPMEHVMISMNGNSLEAHANTSASSPIEMQRFLGESYDDNASALED